MMRKKNRSARSPGDVQQLALRLDKTTGAILTAMSACGYLGTATASEFDHSIIEDGRTQTTIKSEDDHTDITTGTTRGQNAFNSFKAFKVAKGNTVDLHLPDGTETLVNLVHQGKVLVDGTVQSLLDGNVGGHVVFANPNGIVVGQHGTLNVGSLLLTTPTESFMDDLVSPDGDIDGDAVQRLLDGDAPLNASAETIVDGRINTSADIHVEGVSIDVSGHLHAATEDAQQALFEASVNTDGMAQADFASVDGGSVVIGARGAQDNDARVTVSGDVSANGDVDVSASSTHELLFGLASGSSSVVVSGNVEAENITVEARTRAVVDLETRASELASDLVEDGTEVVEDFMETLGDQRADDLLLGGALELFGSAGVTEGDAIVEIADGASLDASGDIQVDARTERTVNRPRSASAAEQLGFGIAAAVQLGETRASVRDGAQVQAAGDLEVLAESENTALNAAEPKPQKGAQNAAVAGIAVTYVDVTTEAEIERGAVIDATDVTVEASSRNSFTTTSKVEVDGAEGVAGVTFALSLVNSETRAELGADLSGAGDISVLADTETAANVTTANSKIKSGKKSTWDKIKKKVSDEAKGKVKDTASSLGTKLVSKIPGIGDKLTTSKNSGDAKANKEKTQSIASKVADKFRLSGALSIGDSNQSTVAKISDGADIEAAGDVTVLARLEDSGIRNSAQSAAAAKTKKGNADFTTSAGVSWADHRHEALAIVGDGVRVRADRMGVGSDVRIPLNIGEDLETVLDAENVFTRFDSFTDFTDILQWFKAVYDTGEDIPGNLFTSTANSTGSAEDVALAGSINVFNGEQNSVAWIGDEADVRVQAGEDGWASELGDDSQWEWAGPLALDARTSVTSLNVSGNINLGWKGFLKPSAATGDTDKEDGVALGGAFQWTEYTGETVAGIGDGAVIKADRVEVDAEAFRQIIAIAPTAGKADSAALNGTFAISRLNTSTRASLAASANVNTHELGLRANDELSIWTVAGAVAVSENVGFGAGVAVNDLSTQSLAYIGDNRFDSPFRDEDDDEFGDAPGGGTLRLDRLDVEALSQGQAGTFAVAGAAAVDSDDDDNDSDNPSLMKRGKDAIKAQTGKLRNKAGDLAENIPLLNAATDEIRGKQESNAEKPAEGNETADAKSAPSKDNTSTSNNQGKGASPDIAASGSVGVNLVRQDTRAGIADVTIRAREEDASVNTNLLAINDTLMLGTAGSGSLIKAGGDDSSFQTALAGAVSVNVLQNDTAANLDRVTLEDAGDTRVEAMSAGDQVSLGLGLAMNVSGDDTSDVSFTGAGSASVNWTANTTRAEVRDSNIRQADTTAPMSVLAYDRTRIATGGGALVVGGDAGVGATFTLSNIGNATHATVAGSRIDMGGLGVRALTRNRILGAGAVGTFSDQDDSVTLAGTLVFNLIHNTVDAAIESSDGERSVVETKGEVRVTAADLDEDVEEGLSRLNDFNGSPEADGVDFALDDLDVSIPDGSDADKDDENFTPDYEYDLPQNAADVASGGSAIVGLAGTLQAGRADNVGASIAVNTISNRHTARIEDARVEAGGDVSVDARDTGVILGASIGAAVTSGDFAGMGSLSGNILSGTAEARVEGGIHDAAHEAVIRANDLTVNGVSSGNILSFAGNISGSAKAAGGAAAAINHTGGLGDDDQVTDALAAQTVGRVANTDARLDDDAQIRGARQSRILSASISGEGAGKVSLGGSLNLNTHVDRTRAELVDSELDAGNLVVEVGDDRLNAGEIFAGSGQFGGAGKAAIGGSFTISTIESQRDALVRGSDVTVADTARVGSVYDADIINMAVGGGGAGTVAVGGSLVTATIAGHSRATIEGGSIDAGDLDVLADGDALRIISAAGNAQGAGTAAVGGALTVNTFSTDRVARLDNVAAAAKGDISVLAGADTEINTGAGAGGGAGTAAVLGSATINTVLGSELAEITGGSDITSATGNLSVRADDGERIIRSISGNVGGAGTAAVGGANVTNTISGVRQALITGGSLDIAETIELASGGVATIESLSASASAGGTAAVNGSLAVSTIDGTEDVILRDASVETGDLQLRNTGEMSIRTASGTASGAGTAAVGGASSTNIMLNRRRALVTGSDLTLSGDLDVLSFNNGSIQTLAAAGGGAGTAAVGGALTANVLESELTAGLRASRVNASVGDWGDARSVRVQAQENGSIDSIAGQAQAGGTAGIGGTGAVNYLGNSINAFIEGGDDAVYRGTNVLVDAQSNGRIQTVSLGAAGAGRAALAGSAAVNVMLTETNARIGRSAEDDSESGDPEVEARNNVGVTAASNDIVRVAAGAASFAAQGGAGSAGAIVNVLDSRTHAGIDGSAARVNALALDPDDTLTVSAGNLQGEPQIGPGDNEDFAKDARDFFADDKDAGDETEDADGKLLDIDALEFNPVAGLEEETRDVSGLAVRASSTQQVGTVSSALSAAIPDISTFGIAGFAGSVLAGTNVIGGQTSAVIDGATINDRGAGNQAAQDVSIGASSHTLSVDYALSGAASTFAGAGVLGASVISRDTEAGLYNADVGHANDLDVFANGTQQGTSVSLGAAFGGVAAGGTLAAVTLSGETSAGIRDSSVEAAAVNVDARNTRAVNLHSGAVSVGAGAAGGSFTFSLVDGAADAFIEGDGNGSTTIETNGGDVRVHAETDTRLFNNVLGAAGGAVGLAGSGAVNVITNRTLARVDGAELGMNGSGGVGALSINAEEDVNAFSVTASAAAGQLAAGAAGNVLVMQGDVQSDLADSRVHAEGDIDVASSRGVAGQQYAASGAIGDWAVTGGLALAVLGSGNLVYVDEEGDRYDPKDDLDDSDNSTLGFLDDALSQDTLAGGEDSDHRFVFDRQNPDNGEEERVDLLGDVAGNGNAVLDSDARDDVRDQTGNEAGSYLSNDAGHRTTAQIRGSDIESGGDVTVDADERLYLRQLTGAGSVGFTAAAGGAAGMVFSYANVSAGVDGESSIATDGNLRVRAYSGQFDGADNAVEQQVFTGSAAVGVGLGAAVAVAEMNNQAVSLLNGDVSRVNHIDVTSVDDSRLSVHADGYAIGGLAAGGIVVGYGARNADVIAEINGAQTLSANVVTVDARGGGGVNVEGIAAGGGIFGSGMGVGVAAEDNTRVTGRIGSGVEIAASDEVAVDAVSDTTVHGEAMGVSVSGGLAIGASVATSSLGADVLAEVGDDARIRGQGTLDVNARLGASSDARDDSPSVSAVSSGGAGGLVGANATVATVATNADVTARIGDRVELPDDDVQVEAIRSAAQEVEATGIAAGIVAAGANLAYADSRGQTHARLGEAAHTDEERMGGITVRADGQDVNVADVLAGSGGVASAQAATSNITTATDTRAELAGGYSYGEALFAGDVRVLANHEDRFGASVDAFQASVAGMSGAFANTELRHAVTADLGDDLSLIGRNMDVESHKEVRQIGDGNSVQAGSGGVASGSAVSHELLIAGLNGGHGGARIVSGEGSAVTVDGSESDDGSGQIVLNARNTVNIRDEVLLDTGGGISGAKADTELAMLMGAGVETGDDNRWTASERIEVAAWGDYSVRMASQAKTYGGVSVVGGNADIFADIEESISLGDDARMLSMGVINLTAGESPQGWNDSRFQLNSRNAVFNYNAVPLDTSANAATALRHRGDVTVGDGSNITSARDVRFAAYDGDRTVTASARAHNPYLDALSLVSGNDSTTVDGSTSVRLAGDVEAGFLAERFVEIDEQGNVSTSDDGILFNEEEFIPSDLVESEEGSELASDEETDGIRIWPIFAAAGNIVVHGDDVSVDGGVELTARGGPEVRVDNASDLSVVIGGIEIADRTGGDVIASGRGGLSDLGGLTVNEVNAGEEPRVLLNNTFDASDPGSSGRSADILVVGEISNPLGRVQIRNASGDYIQGADVTAREISADVPQGSYIVSQLGDTWQSLGSPPAIWRNREILPGNTAAGVELLANTQYSISSNNSELRSQSTSRSGYAGRSVHFFNLSNEHNPNDDEIDAEEAESRHNADGHDQLLHDGGSYLWVRSVSRRNTSRTSNSDPAPSSADPVASGGSVFVEARYIDVNGRIISGQQQDSLGLVITKEQAEELRDLEPGQRVRIGGDDNRGEAGIGPQDGRRSIFAEYDVDEDRINLFNVTQPSGANVVLKGRILSSSTLGSIEVNNGYLDVDIDNQSDIDLVVNDIDTGSGQAANIRIEDVQQDRTTWYRYELGGDVELRGADRIESDWDALDTIATGAPSDDWEYQPEEGLRYEWTREARLERSVDTDSSWWNWGVSNWNFVDANGNQVQDNPWEIISEGVTTGNSDSGPRFQQEITGHNVRSRTAAVRQGRDYGQGSDSDGDALNWEYEIITGGTLRSRSSVSADNPIAVRFTGNDEGRINIESGDNVRLAGNLNNVGGTTSVDAGGIISQAADASIRTRDLYLEAEREIGSSSRAINATMQGGLTGIRSRTGDVFADIQGSDVLLTHLQAGSERDLHLTAAGSILAAEGVDDSDLVRARRVALESASGDVGSMDRALPVQLDGVAQGTLPVDRGRLDIEASGDIAVDAEDSDLFLGAIHSSGGDVRLQANALYNGKGSGESGSVSSAELEALWDNLGLLGGGGEDSAERTVTAFENRVDRWYNEYWQLLQLAGDDVDPANLELDDVARDLLAQRAREFWLTQNDAVTNDRVSYTDEQQAIIAEWADEASSGNLSPTGIDSYAAFRIDDIKARFADVDGVDADDLFAAGFEDDFAYVATDSEREQLTAGVDGWTEQRLRNAINASAVESAAEVTLRDSSNVAGRNVELIADGEIGRDVESLEIDLGSDFTARERALLLDAGPGDVTEIRDGDGEITALDLRRRDLVQVDVLETFDAGAEGNVYIGSAGRLDLGQVLSSGSDVRLFSGAGLFGIGDAPSALASGDLFLIGGSGSIAGEVDGALGVDAGGVVRLASAGGDVLLNSAAGGLTIGQIDAGGLTRLTLPGTAGDLRAVDNAASGADSFDINTDSLWLEVGGGVDAGARALRVQMADNGLIEGEVGGDLPLAATTGPLLFGDLQVDGAFSALADVGRITVDGRLDADQGIGLDANTDIRVAEDAELVSHRGDITGLGASLDMHQTSLIDARGGAINLAVVGDLTLADLDAVAGIDARAGGEIRAAEANNRLSGGDATVSLDAGDAIGTSSVPMQVHARRAEVESASGDIDLRLLRAGEGGIVDSASGDIRLQDAGHGVALDRVNAGGDVMASTDGALALGDLESGRDTEIDAHSLDLGQALVGGYWNSWTNGGQTIGELAVGGLVVIEADRLALDAAIIGADLDSSTANDQIIGQLQVGGNAEIKGESLSLDAAEVQGHWKSHTDGFQIIGDLDVGQAALIQAGSLDLGKATIDGRLDALTYGNQLIGEASVSDDIRLVATKAGSVEYAGLSGGGRLDIEAEGDVSASVVDAEGEFTRGSAATVGSILVSSDADTALGMLRSEDADVQVDALGFAGLERVRARNGRLDVLADGGHVGDALVRDRLRLDTTQDPDSTDPGDRDTWADRDTASVGFGQLESLEDSVHVYSGWNVEGGSADAQIDVVLLGHTVNFDRVESRERDVQLRAVEDVVGQRVVSARDIGVVAGGSLLLESTDYAGEISLEAGRNILVRVGDSLSLERVVAGNNAELFSGGSMTLLSVTAGGDVSLGAEDHLMVDEYIDAGGRVDVDGGDRVQIGSVDAGGAAMVAAAAELTVDEDVRTGGRQSLEAGADMVFRDLIAGEDVQAEAGGAVAGRDVSAGHSSRIASGGTMNLRDVTVAGDVTLDALDDIHIVTVVSEGLQAIDGRGQLEFSSLQAGDRITAKAAEDIKGEGVSTSGHLYLEAGASESGSELADNSVLVDSIDAWSAELRAGHDLLARDGTPMDIRIGGDLRFVGRDVAAWVEQGGAGQMGFDLTGANGMLARDVYLNIESDAQLVGDRFQAQRVDVDTTASDFRFEDGRIGEFFMLTTADLELIMDNLNPAVRNVDVQLFEPDNAFSMVAGGEWVFTDSYVTYYRPGFAVTSPNLAPDRAIGREVEGRSVESDSNRGLDRTLAPVEADSSRNLLLSNEGGSISVADGDGAALPAVNTASDIGADGSADSTQEDEESVEIIVPDDDDLRAAVDPGDA